MKEFPHEINGDSLPMTVYCIVKLKNVNDTEVLQRARGGLQESEISDLKNNKQKENYSIKIRNSYHIRAEL